VAFVAVHESARPLDISKLFFKLPRKSATGNQSLTATIMVNGIPSHASFNLIEILDDALLTDIEVAAVGRWSTNTVAAWRQQPDHPLKWELVAARFVRYRVADLKAFMAVRRLAKRRSPAPPRRRPLVEPSGAETAPAPVSAPREGAP
jgi:hypothetical protein